MRHLSLDEVKRRQIKMLEFFDDFCRKNDITYYLAYGTLLGAIRHKGYIPWDDDVDVMVPRPQIEKLIRAFKSEDYKILTVENCPTYTFPYPRLADNVSFNKIGLIARTHGINIDIYPIDGYPNSEEGFSDYKKNFFKARKPRLFVLKWMSRAMRYLPIPNLPIARQLVKRHEKALSAASYEDAKRVHAFNLRYKPLLKSWFDEKVEVEFEGKKYFAPKEWDKILKSWYGDYMQLPPEDQRHPYHGSDRIYVKD